MCIIFNAWRSRWNSSTGTVKHWKWCTWHRKASAKNSSKLNKYLHSEVNLLIQHIIVQDQDGQNNMLLPSIWLGWALRFVGTCLPADCVYSQQCLSWMQLCTDDTNPLFLLASSHGFCFLVLVQSAYLHPHQMSHRKLQGCPRILLQKIIYSLLWLCSTKIV